MKPQPVGSHVLVPPPARAAARLIVWRVLSVLFLLTMGGIHLYLAIQGAGSSQPFWLNAVGGLVLAIAMVVLRAAPAAGNVLSTLFMAGTLLALVLALTVGICPVSTRHEVTHSVSATWSWNPSARSCSP